jgi:membrane-associated two-gene conflict system component 1 (EACC1)
MSEFFAIKVLGDEAGDETRSLIRWLQSDVQSDDELKGARIRSSGSPIRTDEMGVVTDLVEVAIQPDGIGAALITAILTWLSTRKKSLKVSIIKNSQTVEIEVPRASDIEVVARAISQELNQGDAN